MDGVNELMEAMLNLLENNEALSTEIGKQALVMAKEIVNGDERLNPDCIYEYATFFCFGASWALSPNSTEVGGIKLNPQETKDVQRALELALQYQMRLRFGHNKAKYNKQYTLAFSNLLNKIKHYEIY